MRPRAHQRIVTLRFHRGGFGGGVGLVEIASVRHVAHDREPPSLRLERVARRSHYHVHNRALVDLGYGLVRAAYIESEIVSGEFADSQHSLKSGANVRR
jgi:hypothetical protein